LIPRLTRFYGALDWLQMPLRWLRCYAAMLPILQAEGSLARVAEIQAGDSFIAGPERQKIIARWQRAILPEKPAKRDMNSAEFAAAMQGLGMSNGSR
jgi:hypothetical protein